MGQSASFIPRNITLDALSAGVKQYQPGLDTSMKLACSTHHSMQVIIHASCYKISEG
jgi:hypothetical protein